MVNQRVEIHRCKARCVGLTSSSNSLTTRFNGRLLSPSPAPVDALLPLLAPFGKVFRQPFNRGKWVTDFVATPAARCPSATSFSLRFISSATTGASADSDDTRRMTTRLQQDRRQGEEDNQGVSLLTIFALTILLASKAMKIACGVAAYAAYGASGAFQQQTSVETGDNFQNRLAVCAIDPPPRFFISGCNCCISCGE